MNQAFIVSFVVTTVMCVAILWYGKRRPVGTPTTWGEAIVGATYVFFVLFLAFGVVPHQFIDHADKELGWRKDKLLNGPWDLLKAKAYGGNFPFTISYEALRDIVVLVIHGFYIVLLVWIAVAWQKRGEKASAKAIETSTYGRPLARKA
jgi:1,4-dihydroxy-2-naphthoate octaprenyltransferase